MAGWPAAAFLRGSVAAYALVNAAHIMGIGLLFGAIATLDLRLLGAFSGHPVAHLGPPLRRVAAAGLALAVVTGVLLFTTRPLAYAANPAFLAKLGLVALGLLNVALLAHSGRHWQAALAGGPVHPAVRGAALASLLAWAGAILAGRWIGFLQ